MSSGATAAPSAVVTVVPTRTENGTVVVTATTIKPGWKTTEFWLTLGLMILAHVLTAFVDAPGVTGKIAALVADAIAVSGYSVSRGLVKGASK